MSGSLFLNGTLRLGIRVRGSIRAARLVAGPVTASRLVAQVDLEGLFSAPRGRGSIEGADLTVGPYRLTILEARAEATRATVVADVHADGPDGEHLRAHFDGRPLARGFAGTLTNVEVGARTILWRGRVGELRVDGETVAVREAALAGSGQRFALSGWFGPDAASFSLELAGFSIGEGLRVAHIDVDRAVPGWGPIGGLCDVRLRWRGPLRLPWHLRRGETVTANVDGALHAGEIAGLHGVDLVLAADLAHEGLHVELEGERAEGGRIRIASDLPVRSGRPATEALTKGRRSLTIVARDFDLGQVSALVPSLSGLGGRMHANLSVHADPQQANANADGEVAIDGFAFGRIAGVENWSIATRWTPIGADTRLDGEVRDGVGQLLALSGQGQFDLLAMLGDREVRAVARSIRGSLRLAMRPRPLAMLPAFLRPEPSPTGTVSAELVLSGNLDDPTARFALHANDVVWSRIPAKRPLSLDLTIDARASTAPGEPTVADPNRGHVRVGGRLGDPDGLMVEGSVAVGIDLRPFLEGLQPAEALSLLRAASLGGDVHIAHVDLGDWQPLADQGLSGRAMGTLRLAGSVAQPAGNLDLGFRDLRTGDAPWREAALTLRWDGSTLEASAHGAPEGGGSLEGRVAARLPPGAERADLGQAPLDGSLSLHDGPIAAFGPLYRDLAELHGRVDANLTVEGTLHAPAIRGQVAIREGAGELRTFGVRVASLGGRIAITPERAEVQDFTFRSGVGDARGAATLELEGLRLRAFHGHLDTRQLPLEREGVRLGALTGEFSFDGLLGERRLDLRVEARSASFRLPPESSRSLQALDPHPDVHVRGEDRPPSSTDSRPPVRYVIGFDIPSDLWVTRQDLSIAVHGDGICTIEDGRYRIESTLDLPRGTIDVFNRRFEIDSGDLQFTGEPGFDPQIHLTAHYDAQGARIFAEVAGRLGTPSLGFRSDPPLSTSQILALLVTGRTEVPTVADQQRVSSSANEQAMSFLEGLSLGILQRQLGADLPHELPVVSLEPGREGLTDARLRAGRQIADNVYVEYNHNFGAQAGQNTAQVRIRWRLSRRWSVESFYGDAGTGGVDVVYTIRY